MHYRPNDIAPIASSFCNNNNNNNVSVLQSRKSSPRTAYSVAQRIVVRDGPMRAHELVHRIASQTLQREYCAAWHRARHIPGICSAQISGSGQTGKAKNIKVYRNNGSIRIMKNSEAKKMGQIWLTSERC